MDCFGLRGERMSSVVYGPLDIQAGSGNIIFITGSSGTGKSVLLRSLDPQFTHPDITVERKGDQSTRYSVGWIRDITSDDPLIQYFSDHYGMERALAALNQAGLSEAFVYLKPYAHLSRGQKYRAKLADLALRQDHIWLIDEFCSDLDPLTAKIVSRNLRRQVLKYRRIAFVAAANYRHFIDALAPTRVLLLRFGGKHETFGFKEFLDEFPDTAR
jgi:ABC-type ATPase with predicted acetyltransferase domain